MALTRTNPPGLVDPVEWGYSHVVEWGDLVFVAGQGSLETDSDGSFVAASFDEQLRGGFANLGTALRGVGLDYPDAVQTRVYVVGLDAGKAETVAGATREIWGDRPPATTLIGVAALAVPEALFEVDAIAVRHAT